MDTLIQPQEILTDRVSAFFDQATDTAEDFGHFLRGAVISFDTETTGLRSWHGDIPFAFAFQNLWGERAYFEFEVDPYTRKVDTSDPEVQNALEQIRGLLEDDRITKVLHNAKFDIRMVENAYGIEVAGPGGKLKHGGRFHDTMFMAHCCNSDEMSFGLKELTDKYAGMDHTERDELQEVVKHLRLKLRKYGWNLGCEYQPSHKGTKKKGVPYMDYWLPKTVSRRARELLDDPRWEHLCRTYALLDVDRTMLLFCFYQQLMPRLEVEHTYEKEMRLWPVTYAVESRGVRLDLQRNAEDMLFTTKRIEQVQREMDALSWPDLNPDSRVQMQKLLYDPAYLNLPVLPEYQTEKGNPGTGTKVMKRFADIPVLNWIMHYKAATKSWSYFARYRQFAVADQLVSGGVCIKPDYRQLGAGTARYSCADPNLQQVTSRESSRSLSPIDCRGPFGPRPGYVWLCVDYKGQEIRIFAYVSGEETMMQAIREGKEVHETVTNHGWGGYMNEAGISETINILGLDGSEHGKTESVVKLWQDRWGISYANGDHERVPEEQKREWVIEWLNEWDWNIIESQSSLGKKVTKNKAKMVSFTKIYGGGANAVKDLLHLTYEQAVEFLATYDSRFHRVRQYAKELQRHCKREGYLINVFGRRIECPPLIAYKCVNYMVQSSAADMIKSGMIRCHEFFRQQNLDAHIVMTIHDELVFEINKDHLTNKLIRRVQDMMEDVEGRMDIEMPTDASIVYNCWTDKQELEWKNGRYTVKEKKKA